MAAKSKEQKLFEQHAKMLADMLKLPGNEICADCGSKGPRWASTNIGVFICIRCSGIHRSLGTHISKVKSTNLDKWAPEQIEHIRGIGNIKANEAWEARLNQPKPNEGDTYAVEQFIKEKYVRRRWLNVELLTPSAREMFDQQNRGSSGGGHAHGAHAPSAGYGHHSRDIFGGGGAPAPSSRAAPAHSPPDDYRRGGSDRYGGDDHSRHGDRRGPGSSRSGDRDRSDRDRSDRDRSDRDRKRRTREDAPAVAPPVTAAVHTAAPAAPLVQFDAPVAAPAAPAAPVDAFGAFVSAQSTPAGDVGAAEFFGAPAAAPPKKATKDDIMSLFEAAPTQPAIAAASSAFSAQVYQHSQSLPGYAAHTQYYAAGGIAMVPSTAYVAAAGTQYAARPQGYAVAPVQYAPAGYAPQYAHAAYAPASAVPAQQYGGYR